MRRKKKNREMEKRWLDMPQGALVLQVGSSTFLSIHYVPTNLLSPNTKNYKPMFDHPFVPLRPPDDFWVSLPLCILKAQVLHFSRIFIPMTLYAQKLLFDCSSFSNLFLFLILRTWDFSPFKIFRDKMKLLFCPVGLEMTYWQVPIRSLSVPQNT